MRVSAASLFKNIYPGGQRISSPFGAGEIVSYDIGAGMLTPKLTYPNVPPNK
jgi:hypothetical protein